MASPASARAWPASPEPQPRPLRAPALRDVGQPAGDPDPDATWHRRQLAHILANYGQAEPVREHDRLPLSTRIAVVAGGALIGWAVPIAIVSALIL